MLAVMSPFTQGRPITTLVNTHSNGDHCHGNQLVGAARVIASEATAREMGDLPPSALHALKQLDLGEDGNRFVSEAFGAFRFDDVEPAAPTETFSGVLEGEVAGRLFRIEEVGPAHTAGDVIVHVPDAGVVFTGDILFIDSTPIVWAGPIANWLAACQRLRDLEPTVIVPGHGPVVTVDRVADVEGYLRFVQAEATERAHAGMPVLEAAFDIDLGAYADWSDTERIVVNTDAAYAEAQPGHVRLPTLTMMSEMGRYRAARRAPGAG
jgi:glyoxylase-like metal-dependent hydrolase (beta-lactamase superfamily II)